VALTGGVARNSGVVRALCDELQLTVRVPEHPQLTGALGAALIAADLSG
jgi:activator of 2-hydroxyglutaryl-CoA dehydratase